MSRWLGVVLVFGLLGCASADDVSRQPTRWSAAYPVALEDMVNCLARSAARDYSVTPLINTRQRSAELILASANQVQFIYEVKGLDGDRSEVALKRRKLMLDVEGVEAGLRTNAEQCGQARLRRL